MYQDMRRKRRTESMEATAGNRDEDDEDDDEYHSEISKITQDYQQRNVLISTNPIAHSSLSGLAVPMNSESLNEEYRSSSTYIAHLLEKSDLKKLIEFDWAHQIEYLLNERSHLFYQIDLMRRQFDKQYNILKRRLDETETQNEQLTSKNRSATKELLLYKNLADASENMDSSAETKDYQQLKSTIDSILKENERLYAEIHAFKTSDPVYEQVQMLESTNKELKEQLLQKQNHNVRSQHETNNDEVKYLKSRLSRSIDECEQLRVLNKKLLNEVQLRQRQPQLSSPDQRLTTNRLTSNQQQTQLSPISQHSSNSPSLTKVPPKIVETNIPPLTIQNLRQFDITSKQPLTHSPQSADIAELKEHVHALEQKLQQREYELQTLQIEIEKGTSSIMSSIEDLYMASTSVSQAQHSPATSMPTTTKTTVKVESNVEDLQNELDQLHDKLDELTRENQTLRNRTQEFDTIYEENEYLYAEKLRWNEEMEHGRIRELVLEQEIRTLKEREKEFLVPNETNGNNSNTAQLKLKIDWLHRTNNQLELEIVRLREQLDSVAKKYQETRKELTYKDEHYKKILAVAENQQKLPQELGRLEKIKGDLENQLEREREEHEKIVNSLEQQNETIEKKYSSLYDTILKLQNDIRQKELNFVQQMDEIQKQREECYKKLNFYENQYKQLNQENNSLREEIRSKDEINRDLKMALTSSNNDAQTVYNQLRQLNTNLNDLQQKYDQDISQRDKQIEILQKEKQEIIENFQEDLSNSRQINAQLQHDNTQYLNQIDVYRSKLDKIQHELEEKEHFIDRVQSDLNERSTIHSNISNQWSNENKVRLTKINELEHALSREQQLKNELQRTIDDLQHELAKSRTTAKEALDKYQELVKRFHETDRNFEETVRTHFNETTEPTRRELNSLRAELITKSDQVTLLQHTIEDEKLKRQRLEMKLKRLKDEYINVRKELYSCTEENNALQHELVETRLKNEYNSSLGSNQAVASLRSTYSNENESTTAVQLYLKEKAENQHLQLKCRTYQQKFEQLQKNYDLAKEKYKQRLHEEKEMFDRTKAKYLDHIKNVQQDLYKTRQLLEKDTELKFNQEAAYQQLIDERRQLLTSMVDKDAKVREMRRENLLLTSKIQLLEDQMENLNDRVDRTLRERNQLRREMNNVRFDSNVSIETSSRTSPHTSPTRKQNADTAWNQSIHHAESFGFDKSLDHEKLHII